MQVLAGAQLDPEQLSGRKLSSTITQLLGTYEELSPPPAQVSKHSPSCISQSSLKVVWLGAQPSRYAEAQSTAHPTAVVQQARHGEND